MHAQRQLFAMDQAAPLTAAAREHGVLAAAPGVGFDLPNGLEQVPGRGAASQSCGNLGGRCGESLERVRGRRRSNGALPARGARPMTRACGADAGTGNIQRAQSESVACGAQQEKGCRQAVKLGRVGTKIGDAEAMQAASLVEFNA